MHENAGCDKVSFDFDSVRPKPNNWFSPNVEYEGQGRVEFSDPISIAEGSVKIRFDEIGRQTIEMIIKDIDVELSSIESCKRLVVSTSDGTFSSNDFFLTSRNYESNVSFYSNIAQFDVRSLDSVKYWVLPLSNFISKFGPNKIVELDRHPLRIYPTPIVPEEISDKDKVHANFIANNKNHLISFRCNGGIGFIEMLPDYDDRKNRLLDGNDRNNITAVMIGEIGTKSANEFADLEKWFPFNFLTLLGLATGSEVGAPWIELRDSKGKLGRRIHASLGHPCFSRGHRSIDEVRHRGIGYLLTQSGASLHQRDSYLNPIIKHLIRGGLDNTSIDDRMGHLFRAFEILFDIYNLSTQHLTQSLNDDQIAIIEHELNLTAQKIRSEAKITSNSVQKANLMKIADRVINAKNTERDFGLAFIDLLKKFSLPDADIVNIHHQTDPRSDEYEWHQVLSHYRGIVIHEGYFNLRDDRCDSYDLVRIWKHLHDILIRIVLKMLCYDGTYQRSVLIPGDWAASWPVDWVKPDTPASELGYD
jgi:hypothetical protein